MLKRILTIAAIVFAVCGLALADDTIIIDQVAGTTNEVIATQTSGVNNYIKIDQTATDEWNRAEVHQATGTGYGYRAEITQIAKTYNDALVNQATPGGPGTVKINQTAGTGYNTATVDYKAGWFYDTDVDISQQAGLYNTAYVEMYGAVSYGRVSVDQKAPLGYNVINVESQHGTRIVQAMPDGSISTASYPALPAVQDSASGNNELTVTAVCNGELGLYQQGNGDNTATVEQHGAGGQPGPCLGVYQTNVDGYNYLNAYQGGPNMSATVVQTTTSGNNIANVNQM